MCDGTDDRPESKQERQGDTWGGTETRSVLGAQGRKGRARLVPEFYLGKATLMEFRGTTVSPASIYSCRQKESVPGKEIGTTGYKTDSKAVLGQEGSE